MGKFWYSVSESVGETSLWKGYINLFPSPVRTLQTLQFFHASPLLKAFCYQIYKPTTVWTCEHLCSLPILWYYPLGKINDRSLYIPKQALISLSFCTAVYYEAGPLTTVCPPVLIIAAVYSFPILSRICSSWL